MSLGHDKCRDASNSPFIDPNGLPVTLPPCSLMKAGCPPDKGTFTGAGIGSLGAPRRTILRYALNAVPFIGNVLSNLILTDPTNLPAVVASQETLETATSSALGAILAYLPDAAKAVNDLYVTVVGTPQMPGYVTTCAEVVAQDLSQKLTLIVINALFLIAMFAAIVWSLA